ncbi:MAG: hypothetical protein LBD94_02300 [Rickettsiales bacterium]|jgi:hypothetical protein|nr:hypothetical protein [Rickettsiales bacterium]
MIAEISSPLVMCGYQGAHVIPPVEGCPCTKCSSSTGFCSFCSEPENRLSAQRKEEEQTDEFHFEIIKCKECIRRAADAQYGNQRSC